MSSFDKVGLTRNSGAQGCLEVLKSAFLRKRALFSEELSGEINRSCKALGCPELPAASSICHFGPAGLL